jgi:hypothetical protein
LGVGRLSTRLADLSPREHDRIAFLGRLDRFGHVQAARMRSKEGDCREVNLKLVA